jgi:hypothetical protein
MELPDQMLLKMVEVVEVEHWVAAVNKLIVTQ